MFRIPTVILATFCIGISALADERVIPYQGTLAKNGTTLNGDYELEFKLFGAPSGGSALWSEKQTQRVTGGIFSVALGTVTPLPDAVFSSDELFLSIGVRKVGTGAEPSITTLQNRQKLLSVPFAVRGSTARASLSIDGVDQPDYPVDLRRYVIKVTHNNTYSAPSTLSRSQPVDDAKLLSLCGDDDGCTIRVGMSKWASGANGQPMASALPLHFHIDPTSRGWRASHFAASAGFIDSQTVGADGDNATTHVLSVWNCILTDATYNTPGATTNNDAATGFYFLNWNTQNFGYVGATTCTLIIDD